MPIIYANDNLGDYRLTFADVVHRCSRQTMPGAAMARRLRPRRGDFTLLKPRHSAFFATALQPLLEQRGIRRLILCGVATNLCVLFTAHDAHMLGYPMIVVSDCCAAERDIDHNSALQQLERFCRAIIVRSDEFIFPQDRRIRAAR